MLSLFPLWLMFLFTAVACADERPLSLLEYTQQTTGRFAYGMYVTGKKVGWSIDETRLGEYEGQPAAILTSEGRISIKIFGAESTIEFSGKYVYSLEGEGILLYAEESETDDGTKTTHILRKQGDRHIIQVRSDGFANERSFPLSRDTLRHAADLDLWMDNSARRPQDKMMTFSLDMDSDDSVDTEEEMTFLDREKKVWGGVAVEVARVQSKMDGANSESVYLPQGKLLSGKMGPMTFRLEEEAIARRFDTPVLDMTFEVPCDKAIGNPETLESLTVELHGLGSFQIPQNDRQQVTKRSDEFAVLRLKRGVRAGTAQPLSEEEREKYLREDATVPWRHPKITNLSAEIVGDETDPLKQADRLQKWVYNNLESTYAKNAPTALKVLENRAGDCTEHALLFVALARAAGIPSREISGLMYADETGKPSFAWHAWAQIHDGHKWIAVDPAWNETFIDAAHIMLSRSDDDMAWLELLTNIKVKVIDSKQRSPF